MYLLLLWSHIRSSCQMCSIKNGILKNFAESSENICARVSFLIKEFSCEILRNIEEQLFYRYLWTTASGILERVIWSCSLKKLFWNFYFSLFFFFFFFLNCRNGTKSRKTSQYLITFVKNGSVWLLFYSFFTF